MYILVHTGVRSFQTNIRWKQPAHRNTRLNTGIRPVINIKQTETKPDIQTESIGNRPIIFSIGSQFMCPQLVVGKSFSNLHRIRQTIVQCFHPVILRLKIMNQVITAKTDMVCRHRSIIKRGTNTKIRDSCHIGRLVQRIPIFGITFLTVYIFLFIFDFRTISRIETGQFSE